MQSWPQLSALMSPWELCIDTQWGSLILWDTQGFRGTLDLPLLSESLRDFWQSWPAVLSSNEPMSSLCWTWTSVGLTIALAFSSDLDSWKGLCNLLSGPEVQGLSTKCTTGLTGIKQVPTNLGFALISLWSHAVLQEGFQIQIWRIISKSFLKIFIILKCILLLF